MQTEYDVGKRPKFQLLDPQHIARGFTSLNSYYDNDLLEIVRNNIPLYIQADCSIERLRSYDFGEGRVFTAVQITIQEPARWLTKIWSGIFGNPEHNYGPFTNDDCIAELIIKARDNNENQETLRQALDNHYSVRIIVSNDCQIYKVVKYRWY